MKLKNGINLPVSGEPQQKIVDSNKVKNFALRGAVDFHGLKPSMNVKVGETVKMGQSLFNDKENTEVVFPAPVSGKVVEINRGHRRVLESVVIKSDGKLTPVKKFTKFTSSASSKSIRKALIESGHFSAFRTRPFSKIPNTDSTPDAIFVNTMDTNPLAVDSAVVLGNTKTMEYFVAGVNAVAKLTDGKTFVCAKEGVKLTRFTGKNIKVERFDGCHPAGNTGTHIHFLRPASATKTVWSIGYQDVINIGKLAKDGVLSYEKFVSLAGPKMKNPRVVSTWMGASIPELLGTDAIGEVRAINGSLLSGDGAGYSTSFIGRTATQVSVLSASTDSRGLGWVIPWADKFSSVLNVHLSSLFRSKKQDMDTGLNGSYRAIIPVGHFEKLTPLDILPTQLMRAIIVGDTDMAQKLGLLELDEEDIALFAYADIGKNDFLGALRECLAKVEKEG
ncbi:MAG: Na(+)-translocating NADH-quinone reductase subunit A [Alphaproteobacteria bacterium]